LIFVQKRLQEGNNFLKEIIYLAIVVATASRVFSRAKTFHYKCVQFNQEMKKQTETKEDYRNKFRDSERRTESKTEKKVKTETQRKDLLKNVVKNISKKHN
jgi:hypothetical protein